MAKSTKALAIEADNDKWTMTTKEVAQALGVTPRSVQVAVEKLAKNNSRVFADIRRNSQGGYMFDEQQVTALKLELQNHSKVEKTMTMQEIAEAMGVSKDTIRNCVRRIFPAKMRQGKTAYFDENEVACISKELKGNTYVSEQLTWEAASQVKSTTTRLEVLANYKAATQAMIELLEAEKAELQAKNLEQAQRVQELEHQVEFNEVIDCKRWTDIKKEYHLTKLTKAKVKSYLAERAYWFEKCMGMDKFPTLLIKPEAIDLLVELNKEENND